MAIASMTTATASTSQTGYIATIQCKISMTSEERVNIGVLFKNDSMVKSKIVTNLQPLKDYFSVELGALNSSVASLEALIRKYDEQFDFRFESDTLALTPIKEIRINKSMQKLVDSLFEEKITFKPLKELSEQETHK